MTLGTLAILSVIRISKFCGPAQHSLFTESSASCNFVDLLSTYSLQSHPHLAISWTCSALTPYQFIHPLSFKQNLNRITTTNSTSLCKKALVVMIMTRAFLNVLLLISYIRILYIYLRSLSINPVKRPGFS